MVEHRAEIGIPKVTNKVILGQKVYPACTEGRTYYRPCRCYSLCVEWSVLGDQQKWEEKLSMDDQQSSRKVFLVPGVTE